jgi:hypothetical protein
MYLENKRWPENFNEIKFLILFVKPFKIWSTLNKKTRTVLKSKKKC